MRKEGLFKGLRETHTKSEIRKIKASFIGMFLGAVLIFSDCVSVVDSKTEEPIVAAPEWIEWAGLGLVAGSAFYSQRVNHRAWRRDIETRRQEKNSA